MGDAHGLAYSGMGRRLVELGSSLCMKLTQRKKKGWGRRGLDTITVPQDCHQKESSWALSHGSSSALASHSSLTDTPQPTSVSTIPQMKLARCSLSLSTQRN